MRYIMIFAAIAASVLTAVFPSVSKNAALSSLGLCADVLIPSLFPFFVCANLLISLGIASYLTRVAGKFMKPLFSTGGAGALALILGLLSGYPCGAATACRLYDEGALTKNEASRLLGFANNSGPLFIVSAVGVGLFKSVRIGVLLYISHVAAAIFTGLFFSFFASSNTSEKKPQVQRKSVAFAIPDAVQSVITLCGYVVFFSVMLALLEKIGVLALLCRLFCRFGMDFSCARLLAGGIFEITTALFSSGCRSLPCISAVLSLGGISVLLQTASFAHKSKLSLKPYIIGKLFCAGFSAAFTKLLFFLFPVTASVFAPYTQGALHTYSAYAAAFMLCTVMFLFFYLNFFFSDKKRRKTSQTGNFPSKN